MQVRFDTLASHLGSAGKKGSLAPIYVVSGDEALLVLESADAIRAAARAQGYSEREVLHTDARYDWSQLAQAAQGLSLFATRKLIELRLPNGKPGKEGGEALARFAAETNPDVVLLLTLPKLDRRTRESAWAAALDHAGAWIDVPTIERAALPAWIGQRLARQHQSAPQAALEFIAERVEGNLLAAHQEISKLALLHPPADSDRPRELTLDEVHEAVLNVARYDVFKLQEAMLGGDPRRTAQILDGLAAEGEALPFVLWAVNEELRVAVRAKERVAAGASLGGLRNELRLWGNREALMQSALSRRSLDELAGLLERCADVDRLAKGLRAARADSDPWLELRDLACAVAAPRTARPTLR
jgi:DNA polymerase-3 subunit delta